MKIPQESEWLDGNSLVSPIIAATMLSRLRRLGSLVQYNDLTGQWFMYSIRGPGVWSECSELFVNSVIHRIMLESNVYHRVKSPSYLSNVRNCLQYTNNILCLGYPENPRNFFVFNNGVLDLNQPSSLQPHRPYPACYTLLPYDYDPAAGCPNFLQYIQSFCSHNDDRVELIRAFMRCCLCSWTHVQKFMEVVGEGSTGKSVFQNVLMALVGFHNTVVTSLRDLNCNTFEASSLLHKKLICVSDTEFYSGSVSVLKQITGNDFLVGRRKHQQGAFNIFIEGMVVIVGNYPMYPRYATTGFMHRLIQFPASNVVKDGNERRLIQPHGTGEFEGPLADELSAIFNWVLGQDPVDAEKLVRNSARWVPSLRDSVFRGSVGSNSISSWVEDELIPGPGMYVGGAVKDPSKSDMAYPTYISYCTRNGFKPVSLKVFSTNLLSRIRDSFEWKGFVGVSVERKRVGMFIVGISRSPLLLDSDNLRGGALGEGRSAFPELPPLKEHTTPEETQHNTLTDQRAEQETEGPSDEQP
uniref:Primase n=1 Tax=Zygnema circumcarinatum TaxID=35869 RepID=A0A6N0GXJ1_ZYGCR|nr:primase [Zygnema circumcarinatum]QKQ14699.1 primase [Zygnema circumcarinatum]WEL36343.1 primase [Zygnema circumcarinatum]